MHKQEPIFTENDIPDLTGYVVIVTGGNSGIGYETAKQLALRNARVYIASRSGQKVGEAIRQMEQSSGGKKLDLRFLQLDLQNLGAVKAAATGFAQQESRLDILINNAGVMNVPYQLTADGFELHWQINYLAPFLFTSILLPLLLATASSSGSQDRVRIVNVCSDLAFRAGPKHLQLADVNMTNAHGVTKLMQRYGHSKQASIRHAKELNDRYGSQGVTAYSLHPGVVRSNLQNSDPTILGAIVRVGMKFRSTTHLECSLNSLFCATSPLAPAQGPGRYYAPVGKLDSKADTWLDDIHGNAELWRHSDAELQRFG
ncbi:NAD(P)-binding protein [Thozetella sp. PMI_491]|nr:NAD(P)-binding protein [Thozetella sp. PMI_491]